MYKVFIDNNPHCFNCSSEKELIEEFAEHEFIEAAGGLVLLDEAALFIKRNGKWDIPKGKVEQGEDYLDAAMREIHEESGLNKLAFIDGLSPTWHTYRMEERHFIKKTHWFLLETKGGLHHLKPQIEEGITEVAWFPNGNWEEIKRNTYGSILDVLGEVENLLDK